MTDAPLPPLVQRARLLAEQLGFPLTRAGSGPSCCLPDVGRLLGMLAAGCRGGRIGEIGTGIGYGTSWMASAMPPDATLVTVELDATRAAAAQRLFAGDARVTVVHGDGSIVIPEHAPFDLLFVDGGGYGSSAQALEDLVDQLAPGGRMVVDDVTPVAALPPGSPFRERDPKREAFFGSARLWSVEVVCPDLGSSALVGTRAS